MQTIQSLSTKIAFLFFCILSLLSCSSPDQLPDPLAAGWEGEKVCKVLKENSSIRVLECSFPPGFGHEKHFHAKHFGYTLKGSKFRITDHKMFLYLETRNRFIVNCSMLWASKGRMCSTGTRNGIGTFEN